LIAAAGLFLASRARCLSEWWDLAAQLNDSRQAAKKLSELAS